MAFLRFASAAGRLRDHKWCRKWRILRYDSYGRRDGVRVAEGLGCDGHDCDGLGWGLLDGMLDYPHA